MSRARNIFAALRGTIEDNIARIGDPDYPAIWRASLGSMPAALSGTLPWLLRTRDGNDASLLKVVQENAKAVPHALAVELGDERISWAGLDIESSKVAHVLSELGVRKGDVVALIGKNSPSYLVNILGASRVGAVTALINWHLEGAPLAHAIRFAKAKVVIVEAALAPHLTRIEGLQDELDHVLLYRKGDLEDRMALAPSEPFARVVVNATDDFVYVYTSGTTGMPKPCRISHARTLLAGSAFASVMFRFRPGDKLYAVLPLYHSSALFLGAAACFVSRTPMALREQFSATAFWSDVVRYDATAMLYIGELCRYLNNSPPSPDERRHRIRVAVGNGLRADVWQPFVDRFGIPEIREFYAATEAPGAILNLSGTVGSVGHVPLRRLGPLKLAQYDVDSDELVQNERGRCIECGTGEVGQLLTKLKEKPGSPLGDFRGYTDAAATSKKVMRDVFETGDRYFLSGDLMRFDDKDNFYFVDRIGDTYRWKGENVSTEEVASVLSGARGLSAATVASVRVPGTEGRAGIAGVVCDGDFDAAAFWETAQELPNYAQPRFVRVLPKLATTGTLKIQKTKLRADGIDPRNLQDPLYLRTEQGYVPLTADLFERIEAQALRL